MLYSGNLKTSTRLSKNVPEECCHQVDCVLSLFLPFAISSFPNVHHSRQQSNICCEGVAADLKNMRAIIVLRKFENVEHCAA